MGFRGRAGRWRLRFSLGLAGVLGLMGALAASSAPAPDPEPDADGVLVAFREQAPPQSRRAVLERLGLEPVGSPARFFARVRLSRQARGQGRRLAAAIAQLRRDPSVRVAEPDFRIRAAVVPNDPSYPQLWGLNNTGQGADTADADIDAPEAWEKTTGSASVIVAVLDTGVDHTHPDLAENILRDKQGRVVGADFVNGDANPQDDNGHGTHVAGTIGAVGNNEKAVVGVAWQVKIMPVKMLSASGSGSTAGAIAAIDWAVERGARIINASWGGGEYSQLLSEAIGRARAAGVLFVAAAGNEGNNNDVLPTYPAGYNQVWDNVLSVGATRSDDGWAGFSNYGRATVDLAAPGQEILSTYRGGGYRVESGTSMAAPHVTGAAALVLARFPQATYLQVKSRLLNGTERFAGLASRVRTGRLNANHALIDDVVPPGSPSGLTAVKRSSDALLLAWVSSGDDGAAGTAGRYELRYSGGPITEANFNLAAEALELPNPGPSGSPQVYLLGGLSANSQYYVALRAVDKVGNVSPLVTLGPVSTLPGGSVINLITDNVEGSPLFFGQGTWAVTGEAFASPSRSYADSPGAGYQPNTDASLTLGSSVSLAGLSPRLAFKAKSELEAGYDFLMVEVSADDGQSWVRLPFTITGTSAGFASYDLSLGQFYGQTVSVRFRLVTDGIVQSDGVWLDDITIGGRPLQNIGGPQVPIAPSGFSAQALAQTAVRLRWQDNSSDETHFRVERRVGAAGGWVVIGTPGANQTQLDDTSAAAGTVYTYRIFAVNDVGDSPAAAVQVTTPPFAPPAPSGVSCTPGPSSLSLAWVGSSTATSYTVRRATTPGGPYAVVSSGASVTSYVDAAVTYGTTYYYVITAVNAGGESPPSEEVSGSPTGVPPAAPTRVRAVRPAPGRSVITWRQSVTKGVTRNRVYRATSASGPWELIADVPRRVRITNRGLTPTAAYYYTVTAVNAQGVESPRSAAAFVAARRR